MTALVSRHFMVLYIVMKLILCVFFLFTNKCIKIRFKKSYTHDKKLYDFIFTFIFYLYYTFVILCQMASADLIISKFTRLIALTQQIREISPTRDDTLLSDICFLKQHLRKMYYFSPVWRN